MDILPCGNYLGDQSGQWKTEGMIITKSVFTKTFSSEWHTHENVYLTLVLKGGSREIRKQNEFECTPGMLLLYPHSEPHKNIHYQSNSRNLHLEFQKSWFKKFDTEPTFTRKYLIDDPITVCGLIRILAEFKEADKQTEINLEAAALSTLTELSHQISEKNNIKWVKELYQLLHDEETVNWSLQGIAKKLGVHPVTVSRYFPKYFRSTIGDYIRKIRIKKSLPMLSKRSIALDEIATTLGFTDHSHFTKVFKKHTGITPDKYRQILIG